MYIKGTTHFYVICYRILSNRERHCTKIIGYVKVLKKKKIIIRCIIGYCVHYGLGKNAKDRKERKGLNDFSKEKEIKN